MSVIARRDESGFGLIEVMLSIVVVAIALATLGSTIAFAGFSARRSQRAVLASEAAMRVADEIRSTPINEVWLRYGPNGVVGDSFFVNGLDDGINPSGKITVIVDETLTDQEIGYQLGMPRDLDGDMLAASTDVSMTARILPVIIAVGEFRIPLILGQQ